jgi:hypothetical protein
MIDSKLPQRRVDLSKTTGAAISGSEGVKQTHPQTPSGVSALGAFQPAKRAAVSAPTSTSGFEAGAAKTDSKVSFLFQNLKDDKVLAEGLKRAERYKAEADARGVDPRADEPFKAYENASPQARKALDARAVELKALLPSVSGSRQVSCLRQLAALAQEKAHAFPQDKSLAQEGARLQHSYAQMIGVPPSESLPFRVQRMWGEIPTTTNEVMFAIYVKNDTPQTRSLPLLGTLERIVPTNEKFDLLIANANSVAEVESILAKKQATTRALFQNHIAPHMAQNTYEIPEQLATPELAVSAQWAQNVLNRPMRGFEHLQALERDVVLYAFENKMPLDEAFMKFLQKAEHEQGFGDLRLLSDKMSHHDFADVLASGCHFNDTFFVADSGEKDVHGAQTHRLQFQILAREYETNPTALRPVELYQEMGKQGISADPAHNDGIAFFDPLFECAVIESWTASHFVGDPVMRSLFPGFGPEYAGYKASRGRGSDWAVFD